MGNYLNKGNARVDQASGFKVNFLTQVKTGFKFNTRISLFGGISAPVCDIFSTRRVVLLIRSWIFTSFSGSYHKSLRGMKKGERAQWSTVTKQSFPLFNFSKQVRYFFLFAQLDLTKTSDNKGTFLNVLAEAMYSKYPQKIHLSQDLPTIQAASKGTSQSVE